MSTYATITADVRLDAIAASALRATASWSWFDPDDDPADGTHVEVGDDGSLHLTINGASMRNLCRTLDPDLVRCQDAGQVTGMVTTDCQDGDHWRSVTRFDGDHAVSGSGECFHAPVAARRVHVVSFMLQLPDLLILASDDPACEPQMLTGADAVDACACRGYAEDADGEIDFESPVCRTRDAAPPA